MTERDYLIALASFIQFGPQRIKLFLKYFGCAKDSFTASKSEYVKIGLNEKVVDQFINYRENFSFVQFSKLLKLHELKVLVLGEKEYPLNLTQIDDAPTALFVRGKLLPSDINSVAIVGSRLMTRYGAEASRIFSSGLAGFGVTIVSGLAFGIDLEAHKSALSVGGRCIAVLASGVDNITPRSNEWLGRQIIKTGGAIVSEYPPGTLAQKYYFPYRNRIISGLSRAVIVVEGLIKSGTIHTANHAASQGRSVFAVPGQITSPMSQAPHYLIKSGAHIATSLEDVLEDLNIDLKVNPSLMEKVLPSDKLENIIIESLDTEQGHIDELCRKLGLKVSEVSAKLTVMELKGMVRNLGGGMYKKN